MIRSGFSASAITTLCRMPPDSSCGYDLRRVSEMFTSFRSSIARSTARFFGTSRCAMIASTSWLPIVATGFKLFIALCSTMLV